MRMHTHEVNIGGVLIGAEHPIAVQSMCNTPTADVDATVAQILR
ncbi:MAG: flavodoxin-dependent (E)-4-hydroxy-3-methylbut-2-enyl-diphosphate synthase, partial [Lachnospiraceae bacterium]|nr:flavodoxin-dependent (E)-4-hydroxy-3-methylbut-2-enyl-diphosphate synthase [Lachnospiraceae bacterium]